MFHIICLAFMTLNKRMLENVFNEFNETNLKRNPFKWAFVFLNVNNRQLNDIKYTENEKRGKNTMNYLRTEINFTFYSELMLP